MPGLKPVFGGGGIGPGMTYRDEESIEALYQALEAHGVTTIDTARLYGPSEEWLGRTKAGSRFTLDTKTPGGFVAGTSTGANILQHAKESVQRLGVDKVDIYYIHAPDASIPLADMLSGIDAAHQAGLFTRFGLSNFRADEVERVHAHCTAHGYVRPTVYQGNYSPVARRQETALFPTLRRLGLAFYAYSPLAGGFLTKTKQQVLAGAQAGRFSHDHRLAALYRGLYGKPALLDALSLWEQAAADAGCSRAELAYRWVAHNSPLRPELGDAVIFGASSVKQAEQTLEGLARGPLDAEACEAIDQIWRSIEHEAPLDNYNS